MYSLVFVVSKPQWPRRAIIPDLHLHRQRTPSAHLSELSISECVTIDYTHVFMPMVSHMAYTYSIRYVTTFDPRDIPERDPPRMYARTYVHTYIRTL